MDRVLLDNYHHLAFLSFQLQCNFYRIWFIFILTFNQATIIHSNKCPEYGQAETAEQLVLECKWLGEVQRRILNLYLQADQVMEPMLCDPVCWEQVVSIIGDMVRQKGRVVSCKTLIDYETHGRKCRWCDTIKTQTTQNNTIRWVWHTFWEEERFYWG